MESFAPFFKTLKLMSQTKKKIIKIIPTPKYTNAFTLFIFCKKKDKLLKFEIDLFIFIIELK